MTEQTLFPALAEDALPAIADAHEYIDLIAPENEAPIPLAFSLELDDNQEWKWFSYLTVKTPLIGELDTIAAHVSLRQSCLTALRALRHDVAIATRA